MTLPLGVRSASPLRSLARWQWPVPDDMPATALAEIFNADANLRTVVVARSDGSFGAASRGSFFATMTGEMGFGWALHAKRAVGSLSLGEPIVRQGDDTVLDVGLDLLDGGGSSAFSDLVVVDGARVGIVSIGELCRLVGQEFRVRSVVDDLTGLLNRRGALRELEQLTRRVAPDDSIAQVLFVDLDRFRLVNDAFGHAVGDRVLRAAAELLRGLAPPGSVCARVGGDEFVVAMAGEFGHDPALELSRRIAMAFVASFDVGVDGVNIGATVGLTTAYRGMEVTEILRREDMAMYDGKRRGGGCVTDAAVGDVDRLTELARLETALPHAIATEITAAYQPEVCLVTGGVVGMEALARWSPGGQPVSPGVFVPIAERSGNIPALTDRMLQVAAADLQMRDHEHRRDPHDRGPFVAVNASASHCATSGFARWLLRRLEELSLDPERLVLEVTEEVVFDRLDRVIASTRQLVEAGVSVVLDDFGSGYSSLDVLARLPLTGVKIDRSLIVEMESNDRATTTVGAIVDLAHRFGLYVVAEGVETVRQHHDAVSVGCDLGQGFLYGAPSPSMPVFGVELPSSAVSRADLRLVAESARTSAPPGLRVRAQ